MTQPGRSYNSPDYRYGFNGMEKDDEVKGSGNSYDFGARMYSSRLGRWWSRDPLESEFSSLSPYGAFNNSPIMNIDVDGEYFYSVTRKARKETMKVLKETFGKGHGFKFKKGKLVHSGKVYKSTNDNAVKLHRAFKDNVVNNSEDNLDYRGSYLTQLNIEGAKTYHIKEGSGKSPFVANKFTGAITQWTALNSDENGKFNADGDINGASLERAFWHEVGHFFSEIGNRKSLKSTSTEKIKAHTINQKNTVSFENWVSEKVLGDTRKRKGSRHTNNPLTSGLNPDFNVDDFLRKEPTKSAPTKSESE